MCLSPEVSFAAGAILVPAGGLSTYRAFKVDPRYIPLAALPAFFGIQQVMEGFVWVAGARGDADSIAGFSLAYMFFAWVVWPVWVPVSTYFIESGTRRALYLAFAIGGGMLGALQYVPYYAHDGWLVTTFLQRAVRYGGTELLDLVTLREVTYSLYAFLIIAPFLLSRDPQVRVFGVLVSGVLAVTYLFFAYAYISVFCFGGALISFYLVRMMYRKPLRNVTPSPAAGRNV